MLSASLQLSPLGLGYSPSRLHIKEGRLHKHLLKWNGVGSPYSMS
ncbi:hypothetical protein S7335_5393 [Synechococcus sp. PCC 7335]|nr:hypothetical protein S7335_5393 [Synechococcus sp. PCC 7335]